MLILKSYSKITNMSCINSNGISSNGRQNREPMSSSHNRRHKRRNEEIPNNAQPAEGHRNLISGNSSNGSSYHGVSSHGVSSHGVSSHGVSSHGVSSHGVSSHGDSSHGGSSHGGSSHGGSSHGGSSQRTPVQDAVNPKNFLFICATKLKNYNYENNEVKLRYHVNGLKTLLSKETSLPSIKLYYEIKDIAHRHDSIGSEICELISKYEEQGWNDFREHVDNLKKSIPRYPISKSLMLFEKSLHHLEKYSQSGFVVLEHTELEAILDNVMNFNDPFSQKAAMYYNNWKQLKQIADDERLGKSPPSS